MAYVTICNACLDGRHDECADEGAGGYDVGLCVCAHGGEETAFIKGVRESRETARKGELRRGAP